MGKGLLPLTYQPHVSEGIPFKVTDDVQVLDAIETICYTLERPMGRNVPISRGLVATLPYACRTIAGAGLRCWVCAESWYALRGYRN